MSQTDNGSAVSLDRRFAVEQGVSNRALVLVLVAYIGSLVYNHGEKKDDRYASKRKWGWGS